MRTGARRAAAAGAIVLGLSAGTPYLAVATIAAGPVDLGGVPVDGSTDPTEPTVVTAGLWSDSLGTSTAAGTHHFRYTRTMDESTVHVGVVATSADPNGDGISVVVRAGETDCDSDSESPSSATPQAVFGAAVTVGPSSPGVPGGECLDMADLTIEVTRGSSSGVVDLPFALKVVEEGPVVGLDPETGGGLPVPAEDVTYDVPEPVPATDLAGGTGFDDAPTLDANATVTLEVPEGDELLFRVPLTWGERVVAAARVPALDDDTIYDAPYIDLRVVDPMRNTLDYVATDETSSTTYGGEPVRLSVASQPLRYLNRWDDQSPTLPGDFWVAVAVERTPDDTDRAPLTVPVELTVAVSGTAGEGAPPYQQTVLSPSGSAGPEGYGPETPYLVGDGRFAAVASGNPRSPEDPDEAASWWGVRHVSGLGFGVVSLACCVTGVVWLRRRRA